MVEEYMRIRTNMEKDPRTSIEQRRFGKFTDLLFGTVLALLTPEIGQRLVQNISNRWVCAILRNILPLFRLSSVLDLCASVGFAGITAVKWFTLQPVSRQNFEIMFIGRFFCEWSVSCDLSI
uniref:Uncharacterized protein n=1 Tax=Glaukea argentea TaxID=2894057 RepID=A0A386B1K6_9CHLO|nr:hypothetical protein [Udotea argentea]AYC65589.1 hypothetical protein [Udotea argentea]